MQMMDEDRDKERAELPLKEHLRELRLRLIRSFCSVCIMALLSYCFIDQIFKIISIPLIDVLKDDKTLIFTSYPEAFFTYLKLALTSGVFLASPWILYEIWGFVAPGLYQHEKRYALPFILIGSLFFVIGGLFGYFTVFPAAFNFLSGYETETLKLYPSISEYYSLSIKLLLGFGTAFELPIILVSLGIIGIVKSAFLKKYRKYALLISFIIGAALTPTPDIINQTLLAVPLFLLYELSILILTVLRR